jgi:hypothetical protein
MRWLERTYQKLLSNFKQELASNRGLTASEIEVCLEIAGSEAGAEEIGKHLANFSGPEFSKRQVE